jgi:hypothetical protein
MRDVSENCREGLLAGLQRFVLEARHVAGVREIALVGSIVTTKENPKDVVVLVIVTDDADLTRLAAHARRLQGHAQSLNRGADVFLANDRLEYIGRTCRWRDCRPGIRRACDARHCGRRPHLHDDVDTVTLSQAVVAAPPATLWPVVTPTAAVRRRTSRRGDRTHRLTSTRRCQLRAGGSAAEPQMITRQRRIPNSTRW